MPPSPQQPYGQQPPHQGPYGQQPPPQGPYGQQPYPPQQSQPQPYGQQPHVPQQYPPQQYPPPPQQYGAPHPAGWQPPPPPKSRTGLVLGLVGGVVGLVVLGAVGLWVVGTQSTSGFPEAEYKLALPETVLDGEYKLAQDLSDTEGSQVEDEAEGAFDARDVTAAVAQYAPAGDGAEGALIVSGMYGRFKNTDAARDNMLKGAAGVSSITVVVPPEDYTPGDSDLTISCQVVTQNQAGSKITYPMCAWADGNTGASVAELSVESVGQDASKVDVEAFAERTLQVRSELRQPIS
ncbi:MULTISPECIES: hypothetical protein [unclassified Streptomyces]|uniref:hypothetical protein n=1 Tax=unclassified Streptomyces TaxID=2593676 RepID=UPI0008F1D2A2|nr:hypothetical protein SAMN04487980_1018140 [Streptomyces sp. cf124]